MPDLRPRKLPRQARARATVDALVEACARLLRERGLAGVTTNAIAERAGVGIGSLYEFFPNREAVLAELTRRRLARLIAAVEEELEAALAAGDPAAGADRLLHALVAVVAADRALYRMLLREAPFLRALPEVDRTLQMLFALARAGSERAGGRLALPHPVADVWLIGRMLAHAVLEISFVDEGAPSRERLTRELVRLTIRMLQGGDPAGTGRTRRAPLSRSAARARAAR